MANTIIKEQQVVSCKDAKTHKWYAWIDAMPPKPDRLYVTGEVQVSNPGIYTVLSKKEPQGINPAILLLDLHLVQKPGIWPQIISWDAARYDEVIRGAPYIEVSIFCGGDVIATMPVDIIS